MFGLCKFKNIFGTSNTGFHSTRFLGMAFWDLFGTFLIAMLIAKLYKRSVLETFAWFFFIGQLLHYVMCVDTAFIRYLKLLIY